MTSIRESQIFQFFRFCNTLGVFPSNLSQLGGVFGLSRGVLGGLRGVLEASWRHLGRVFGHLGGILDTSWGKNQKKVEETVFFGKVWGAKMEAKIIKIHEKNATCFS